MQQNNKKGFTQQHEAPKSLSRQSWLPFFSTIKNFNYSSRGFLWGDDGCACERKIEIVVEKILNENSSTNIILLPTQRAQKKMREFKKRALEKELREFINNFPPFSVALLRREKNAFQLRLCEKCFTCFNILVLIRWTVSEESE